jgi:hypothetical protein
MCDEDNGYYMPDDGSGAVDTAFGGACVRIGCTYEFR